MKREVECYKRVNQALAGEKVFLLDKMEARGLTLPEGDLMVFDDQAAAVNAYDRSGRMTSGTFYGQLDELRPFLEIKQKLARSAKPLKA